MLIALIAAAVVLVSAPNNSDYSLFDGEYVVVVNGEKRTEVTEENFEKYFSYDLVKSNVDKHIWMDEEVGIITITNKDGIIRLDKNTSDEILIKEQKIYIKQIFLEKTYNCIFQYIEENNVTIILNDEMNAGEIVSQIEELCVRTSPTVKAPRVKVISSEVGKVVAHAVENSKTDWIKVITLTGETGYVRRSEVNFKGNKNYKGEVVGFNKDMPGTAQTGETLGSKFKFKKINMIWEAVYSRNPDVTKIGDMQGLNVIAPTWFELLDETGSIANKADRDYVDWAHNRGYYVWGTIVSVTDYDMTSKMLHNYEVRSSYIEQIVGYALEYELDGINIDFEYMYEEDKMLFTQFARELSTLCHINGLIVSCDVTILSNSPKWSLCYDRKSLADSLDFICVMFYDQHSAGSKQAGSVAQLSWTKSALELLLGQIPNDKLILSMPFYTRLWEERESENGDFSIKSKAIGMEEAGAWVEEKGLKPEWDEDSGQFYTQYEEEVDGENVIYRLWIEDKNSIKKRVELVNSYNLAGCSAWRRGFETGDIWAVIDETLKESG